MRKKIFTLFCLILSILTLSSCDVGVKRASLEDFEYERRILAEIAHTL